MSIGLNFVAFPNTVKAVIFDMDGLLLDTEVIYKASILQTVQSMGYEMTTGFFETLIGRCAEDTCEYLLSHYGNKFDADKFLTRSSDIFDKIVLKELKMKSGALSLLDYLSDENIPCAIATSSSHKGVSSHLNSLGIAHRFQVVVAWGDYNQPKPKPDPFLRAAEMVGLSPAECLALEDSYPGVRAASDSGMMTIMVPDLLPPTDEMLQRCLCIASSLDQVRDMLEESRKGCRTDERDHRGKGS